MGVHISLSLPATFVCLQHHSCLTLASAALSGRWCIPRGVHTYLWGLKYRGQWSARPPSFPILGVPGGGGPTIHILPPILGTLKLPQVLALPRALPSGSNLRVLPNLPVTAELVLGPAQSFLAQPQT